MVALPACARPAPTPPALEQRALDRSTFDPTADACTDFYQYACGGFATLDHVPPDRGEVVWAAAAASAANGRAVQHVLVGAGDGGDPEVGRLRTFYGACMASATDQTAAATLARWMKRIDGIATRDDALAVLRELHRYGIAALFSYAGEPDQTNRTRHRGELDRGAIGRARLYTDTGPEADTRRADRVAHIQRMAELAGVASGEAQREAAAVFALDRALAATDHPPSDQWDSTATEHPMAHAALEALAPHVGWRAYLELVGAPPDAVVNVVTPAYLQAVDRELASRSIADLRGYLRWQFLNALATALPAPFAEEHRRFVSLFGVQREPRAEDCQLETIKALGVELSRQFSRSAIGPLRDQARPIAERVQAEIARSIRSLDWLSPSARAATAQKVSEMTLKIGYPDRWPATGTFAPGAATFLDNVLAARAYEQQRSWTRAGAARSRDSWENIVYPNAASGMAAARLTIPNGFPDPLSNSIVFTAAFLQAPLVDPGAPVEVSYGRFGAVMAHELVHMIEEHQFDRVGELHETWAAADLAAHDARRACVVDQANEFVAFDTTHLDGKQTYSENVADLSGTAYAYAAMVHELGAGVAERGPDGFTRGQRFFIAYAQYYCQAERPAFARENLRGDPHAPPRYRVNGPLANLPGFAAAFACKAGSAMVRPDRCAVW